MMVCFDYLFTFVIKKLKIIFKLIIAVQNAKYLLKNSIESTEKDNIDGYESGLKNFQSK